MKKLLAIALLASVSIGSAQAITPGSFGTIKSMSQEELKEQQVTNLKAEVRDIKKRKRESLRLDKKLETATKKLENAQKSLKNIKLKKPRLY